MNTSFSNRSDRRPTPPMRTPWLLLLLTGLAGGTLLGWALNDMNLGTAYGVMGALITGALWRYLRPFIQRMLTGRRHPRNW